MSLQNKLLLMIGLALFLTFAGVSIVSYQTAHDTAINNLWSQAEKVRNLLMSYRRTGQKAFLEQGIPLTEKTLHLLPAFGLGLISKDYKTWDHTGFSFENVSDRPRNKKNQADTLELEIMEFFRENPKEKVIFKPFDNDKGEPYYLYARPIWIEKHCLKCHDDPKDAPKTIRDRYDTAWFYKEGELRGLLSIKVPANTVTEQTWQVFKKHAIIQLAGFILIFIIIVWMIRRHISTPLNELTVGMSDISQGNYDRQIIGMSGEFAVLGNTFNGMAEKLRQHQTALHALNTELEQRVEMRTEELAHANHQINTLNAQLQDENHRMGAELAITRHLQDMLLPKKAEYKSADSNMDITSFIAPATEVGGDYYDILPHENGVTIGVGDVTGHGLESGMIMLMVQMAIRTLIRHKITDLRTILNVVNIALLENIQRMGTDKNLSLLLLDFQDNTVNFAGQHEEVLIVRENGEIEREDTIDLGFTIGLETNISQYMHERVVDLKQGEGVVIYTDGITEAFNPEKEQYGLDRLCDVITKHWQGHSSEMIQTKIIEDVYNYIGDVPIADDITLLVIKYHDMKKPY